jgi:hypothetical protein
VDVVFSLLRFALSTRTRNLVVPARRSLAMLFFAAGRRMHAMKILPTRASFVSAVGKMVRGVDVSYLFGFCGTHHVVGC